ncbi:MAG: CpsB/CapC family capsule biosynthesis tyrosine phosphatase [Bacillota bacterium]|nr:CpsB/CapC family capsule biosynthesis tyrosine phosphatase [Bacillota bacterium]
MIDIHCHILPGLDDGAKTADEAVRMARIAQKEGITAIMATPHFMEGTFTPSADSVLAACTSLSENVRELGIALDICPGMEIYLCPELDQLVRRGKVLTLNNKGRHILIELPFDSVPSYSEEVLFSLLVDGTTPVLAHPERNDSLDLDTLGRWIEQGLLVQANSGSFTGFFGQRAKNKAERLLLSGMIHFIASDGHSAGRRAPLLSKAMQRVAALTCPETSRQLFTHNPHKVLQGKKIDVKPVRPVTGMSLWRKRLQCRLQGIVREA